MKAKNMSHVKFSHIGIVVKDISKFGEMLERLFSAAPLSKVIEDPNQEAFLRMYRSGETFIELISPASENSHVQKTLTKSGECLAHLCFETDDLDQTLIEARNQGALVFRAPTPAVLFGGKRVAFAMLPNRMIVEFVETDWQNKMQNINSIV